MYMVNIYIEIEKDVVDFSSLLKFEFFCDECGCCTKFFNDYKVSDKKNSNSKENKQEAKE